MQDTADGTPINAVRNKSNPPDGDITPYAKDFIGLRGLWGHEIKVAKARGERWIEISVET